MSKFNIRDGENQFQRLFEDDKYSELTMGVMRAYDWCVDPRRLVFTFSRYKFVSKILEGKKMVAEIGCGDGLASKLVAQTVSDLHLTDFDDRFVEITKTKYDILNDNILVYKHDIVLQGFKKKFEAIYALDVLEHIPETHDERVLNNICESLNEHGILILGMPSLESQVYASPISKEGHVNCKSGEDLKSLMQGFFHNVLLFSMNDEVVHTGFSRLAHYIFAIGFSPKSKLNV